METGDKSIDIHPAVMFGMYAACALFLGAGVLGMVLAGFWGLAIVAMGLCFLLPTMAIHRRDTSVTWSATGICGARSDMTLRKHCIAWTDIESVVLHPNQAIQLRCSPVRSVWWSVYQKGWTEPLRDLRRHRPDLDIPSID